MSNHGPFLTGLSDPVMSFLFALKHSFKKMLHRSIEIQFDSEDRGQKSVQKILNSPYPLGGMFEPKNPTQPQSSLQT